MLGPLSASALIAGCMIGVGIFCFVSDVAEQLPSRTAILSVWLVGAAIASCGALCLAELASTYPETGGIYAFFRRAYGSPVAFLFTWAEFLIMRTGSYGIMVVFFAGFAADFAGLDVEANPWLKPFLAVGAIAVITAINIAGVRSGSGVQNVLTAIKILCLLGIVMVGAVFAAGWLEPQAIQLTPKAPSTGSWLPLFGAALIAVMWSYGGWDESPFIAEEVRNPERNLPRSILGGLWTVALLFLLVNAAYLLILTPAEMAGASFVVAASAMERALGGWARGAVAVALILSTFGAANGLALTGGRLAYAAGRHQPLFRWFRHTHPKTKTPVRSLVVQAAITAAIVVIVKEPFQLLLYTGLAYWTFAGLMAAAVIVLRLRDPERPRPFRVWWYPVLPALFILASLGMAASVIAKDIKEKTNNALATVIILAVGLAVYAAQALIFKQRDATEDEDG